MSHDRHSYVHFYASDWVGGTARMTRIQRAVYFDVCCYCWDKAKEVPASELPLMLGDIDGWQDILELLIAAGKIYKTPAGGVGNSRAMSEAAKALDLWKRRSGGGKKSAQNRGAAKSDGNSPAKRASKSHGSTVGSSRGSLLPTNQNQNHIDSVPNGTGADAPKATDPKKPCYEVGKPLLAKYGKSEREAGGIITKWLKEHPPEAVLNAIQVAGAAERHDIVAFIVGCLKDPLAIPEFLKRGKQSPHDKAMAGFAAASRGEPN